MDHKKFISDLFEKVMNKKNYEAASEFLAPHYTNHSMPFPVQGPEGMKAVLQMFNDAFPDMHIVIDEAISEGNSVFARGHWTGTHKGEFNGIPATGKKVKVEFMDCWHIENGKAVDNWVQMDNLGLMMQLGVIPAPAAK